MDWNDLRFFLAVARTHSLAEAARQLRVSQATVARRVAALETALNAVLFAKRTDGYSLTEAGDALLQPAEQAEAQLLWLERSAGAPADRLNGLVRLGVPELLGQHFIIPSLTDFFARYPAIRVDVMSDVRPMRLSKREADILVRLVQPKHGDYIVRRVGSIALALYGSKTYVAQHGNPKRVADLIDGHRFIGWESSLAYLPMAQWLEDMAPEADLVLRSHSLGAQLAAADAGLGLAVLPALVAKRLGLVRVLEAEDPLTSDVWLLQQTASHALARVRALADHVTTTIEHAELQLNAL